MTAGLTRDATTPLCSIEGCGFPLYVRGWCNSHYKRWYRYGSPHLGFRTRRSAPLAERMGRYIVQREGCWGWTGARNERGYGVIGRDGGRLHGNLLAPRAMWELVNGPIPDGLCVLHTCDNPPCTNPSHLWLGTRADNNHDMMAKGRHASQKSRAT